MNAQLIKLFVLKDWFFCRHVMALYVLGGFTAIAIAYFGGDLGLMVGGIALVATVMGIGIHLVFITVVNERKEQTLPFVMSMPLSIQDYTAAKIVANASAFFLPWLILSAVALITVHNWDVIPNGFVPLLTIMLLEMAVCNFIILAAALITESEGWTIAVMAVCNTAFSVVFFLMKGVEGIGEHMSGEIAVWNTTVFSVIALEVLIVVFVLAATFFLQSKKTDFL